MHTQTHELIILETFKLILELINTLLIKGLFASALIIILTRLIFKTKISTDLAIVILKWIIISFSFLRLIDFLIQLVFFDTNEYSSFINRATGPYYWAYWCMIISSTLLPLLLFLKRPGKNVYFILLISILINIGWWFERFVIIVTSIHQDYLPESKGFGFLKLIPFELIAIGVFWGVLFLIFGNIWKNRYLEDEEIIDDSISI